MDLLDVRKSHGFIFTKTENAMNADKKLRETQIDMCIERSNSRIIEKTLKILTEENRERDLEIRNWKKDMI